MGAVSHEQHLRNLAEQSGLEYPAFLEELDRRYRVLQFLTTEFEKQHRGTQVAQGFDARLGDGINRAGRTRRYTIPIVDGLHFAAPDLMPGVTDWDPRTRRNEHYYVDSERLAQWSDYTNMDAYRVLLGATFQGFAYETARSRALIEQTDALERRLGNTPPRPELLLRQLEQLPQRITDATTFDLVEKDRHLQQGLAIRAQVADRHGVYIAIRVASPESRPRTHGRQPSCTRLRGKSRHSSFGYRPYAREHPRTG